MRTLIAAAVLLVLGAAVSAGDPPKVPTLFVVGDSTVKNGTRGQQGWGDPLIGLFDQAKVKVENHAIGGRSSRTFITEGRWDKVLAAARAGDFVLIQMGHNDGGPLDDTARARGTIRGVGEEPGRSTTRSPRRRKSSTPSDGTCASTSPMRRPGG